jgi:predicted Ser/Thr protein kinase
MSTLRAGLPREPMIGPYRPVQRIGEGGMGVVHLALDPQGRAVALKVLRDPVCVDPEARARLRREVESLRRVRSPHVAEVLGADLDGDRPYVATRFVPGPTLEDHVRARGPLQVADVVRVGVVLADALAAIHAARVVHRDLKPANVLLLDGDPVIVDFGIAHLADESRITRAGLVMGTPGYLSPEVVGGWPVTPATDWWGWGSTLAFAASGRSPFGTGPLEVVLDRVRQGRPDLAGVDPRLARVLEAALAPDPARRPPGHVLVSMLRAPMAVPATLAAPVPRTQVRAAIPPTRVDPSAPARVPEPPATRVAAPAPQRVAAPAPQRVEAPPAQRRPAPAQLPPPTLPARPPSRAWSTAVLLALLAALAGTATVAPGAVVVGFVALAAVARTIDRSALGLWRRRTERGARSSDAAVTVLALPWRLLMATGASLLAAVLPALVALAAAFITASSVAGGQAVLPSSGPALAAGAVAGVLVAWWGPGGGSLRRGSRQALRGLAPTRGVAVVLALLLVSGGVGAAVLRAGGQPPDPAPFHATQLPWWVAF